MEDKAIEIIMTLPKPMQKAALGVGCKIVLLLRIGQGNSTKAIRTISDNINGMLLAMEEMGLTKAQCEKLLDIQTAALMVGMEQPRKTGEHIN